jgi:hypothetical protein
MCKTILFVYAGLERSTKEALILPDTTGPPDSKVELLCFLEKFYGKVELYCNVL